MSIQNVRRLATASLVFLLLHCQAGIAAADYWADHAARAPVIAGAAPSSYRTLDLDWSRLRASLGENGVGVSIDLPSPDGGHVDFMLSDSGTLPPELAARHPDIRSYIGTAMDGTQARIDISPIGVNAMVYAKDGSWIVRPEVFGQGSHYLSFKRSDVSTGGMPFRCTIHGDIVDDGPLTGSQRPQQVATTTGASRRNYRAAVAANSAYVAAIAGPNPPTVAIGLAAVTVAMNRVNQVYERDLSIHMTLVANNDLIIYPTPATDPYSNDDNAIDQNTGNLNTVIGNANYDIGHVFTTGSGGVAGLGVICNAGRKGEGTTGLSDPAELQSDVFYIDFVAHEIGHQFGGAHTFNSTSNGCGGGNRTASSAYEPGSGSTIMAYAGLCGAANNLQSNSDAYFHARSLDQINTRVNAAVITACGSPVANPAAAPVIAALSNYTIPASTPFALTGSATSNAGGATLNYDWEQYDLGAANNTPTTDPGTGPIQRSFNPAATPTRYVPRPASLISGTAAIGEILPTTTRTLTYRLTVRDNVAGGGSTSSSDSVLTVLNTAGPFVVTAPTTATPWNFVTGPATQTVSWNVAATDLAPVSCATVNIDLVSPTTTDLVRSAVLATALPNSGSAVVTVPNVQLAAARVRVACASNVFYNVSAPFAVTGTEVLFKNGFDSVATP